MWPFVIHPLEQITFFRSLRGSIGGFSQFPTYGRAKVSNPIHNLFVEYCRFYRQE